jgi:hypothetical protein
MSMFVCEFCSNFVDSDYFNRYTNSEHDTTLICENCNEKIEEEKHD